MRSLSGLAVTVVLALLLVACGGDSEPEPTPSPTETPAPTLSPTPRPTSTPYPVPTEPPPTGRVTTTLNTVCFQGEYGLVLRVRYATRIRDTDSPDATITRVRVYVDGALRADTGPLSHRIYVDELQVKGIASRLHAVQLRIDTRAAPKPQDLVQLAQCPPEASQPVARLP